jgi:hypothetical protein
MESEQVGQSNQEEALYFIFLLLKWLKQPDFNESLLKYDMFSRLDL